MNEDVPPFNDSEVEMIDIISEMLPLIRFEEFLILEQILENGAVNEEQLKTASEERYDFYRTAQIKHALNYLQSSMVLTVDQDSYELGLTPSDELKSWLKDLVKYGLNLFDQTFANSKDALVPYQNYRKDQIMLATLQDKVYVYQKGTKIESDGTVYIFANLKKDRSLADHLKYNDVFIDEQVFKWESQTNTTLDNTHGKKLIKSKEAHLFVRREENEDGIVLPYTYVGVGQLTDPEVTDNPGKTLAFNLTLKNPLPKDLQFEFISNLTT